MAMTIKRYGNISTAALPTGASNAGGVGKNSDSRRIAGYRSMTGGVRTTAATVHRAVYFARSGKSEAEVTNRRLLSMCCTTRS